jgi:hypothetical protein
MPRVWVAPSRVGTGPCPPNSRPDPLAGSPPCRDGGRPDGDDEGLAQLLDRFADSDEPITAEPDVETRLAEAKGALDPQDEDPALRWPPRWPPTSRTGEPEIPADHEEILRLAARAEFDGKPPPGLRGGLLLRGSTFSWQLAETAD